MHCETFNVVDISIFSIPSWSSLPYASSLYAYAVSYSYWWWVLSHSYWNILICGVNCVLGDAGEILNGFIIFFGCSLMKLWLYAFLTLQNHIRVIHKWGLLKFENFRPFPNL